MVPFELALTAGATAAACGVPGVFLVLRRQAMAGDAIGHVILPGVVIGFLAAGTLQSPIVILTATLVGVAALAIVEALEKARFIRNDAGLGLVYPALFSVGVILVTRYAGSVHLDIDAVLLGELTFAQRRRFMLGDIDLGPWSAVVMIGVFALNTIFVATCYKELKLTTFDPVLAKTLGIRPGPLHYALMTLVALTVVAAFDAAGPVLVVAFLVAPAATAYLLTDRLSVMLLLSVLLAVGGAVVGCEVAERADQNYAGPTAATFGAMFALALAFAPRHGLAARALERRRLRGEFELGMLVVHLNTHAGTPAAAVECRRDRLPEHLNWPVVRVDRVVRAATEAGLVAERGLELDVTAAGRELADELLSVSATRPT